MAEIITSGMGLYGRRRIYTNADVITAENVLEEVNSALNTHMENLKEEEYLYWYRRGLQPILERKKEIRSEICNKVTINNADMIVTFKDGYFLTKPATYISRKEDEGITEKVKELNEYVNLSGKYEADNQVVDWFHTVGLGVLYVDTNDEPGIPFKTYALDPRSACVAYSRQPGNKPVMAIKIAIQDKKVMVDAITKEYFFRLEGKTLSNDELKYGYAPDASAFNLRYLGAEANIIGEIPIVEYTYNKLRMGAFENVLSIMDEINLVQSNRIDGIEQFIQSLMILYNCDLDEGQTAASIRKAGFVALKNSGENKADIKVLNEQLDQSQTQVTLKDLYEQMLDKAGVPNSVHDGGSTSDTGSAVYLRNGWAVADTCARNTEDEFKQANAYFDRIILAICRKKIKGFNLTRADFELKIVRNDLSNLLVKTQAAMNMKDLGFAPALAFERSGLSNDPLSDVEVSKEYIEKVWSNQPTAQQMTGGDPNASVQNSTEPKDRTEGGEPDAAKA